MEDNGTQRTNELMEQNGNIESQRKYDKE
jgi:hypothetical protein